MDWLWCVCIYIYIYIFIFIFIRMAFIINHCIGISGWKLSTLPKLDGSWDTARQCFRHSAADQRLQRCGSGEWLLSWVMVQGSMCGLSTGGILPIGDGSFHIWYYMVLLYVSTMYVFNFKHIWDENPRWLIFFQGVQTRNPSYQTQFYNSSNFAAWSHQPVVQH